MEDGEGSIYSFGNFNLCGNPTKMPLTSYPLHNMSLNTVRATVAYAFDI